MFHKRRNLVPNAFDLHYFFFRANRIILLSDFSINIRYPYCFNCVTILRTYMIGTELATLGEKDRDVQIESSNHIRQV